MKPILTTRKKIAIGLLGLWVMNIAGPSVCYALTSGPAQPEAQAFQPAGVSDMVDLFSGDFKYNIPLLDVDGYPVNLNYQSGTGMDDEASWVGLGWNVNVGAINRQVRGLPDDMAGDLAEVDHYTKPNVTVGGKLTAKIEVKGKGKSLGVGGSLSLGVFNNNYTGIGAEVGANAGISFGGPNDGPFTSSLGLGINSNTATGVEVSPYMNLNITENRTGKITESAGMSASLGYNTRSGLKNLTLGASFDVAKNTLQIQGGSNSNGLDAEYAKTGVGVSSSGSAISFNSEPINPSIQIPYRSRYGSFSLDAGGVIEIVFLGAGVSGYKSVREVASQQLFNPTYGFLYAERGKNQKNAVMDFTREKDNPAIPELPNLALPVFTPDLFSFTSQTGSGQFRLYRGGSGAFFDNEVTDDDGVTSLGADLGYGFIGHGGVTLFKQSTKNTTRKWASNNNYLSKADFQDISYTDPGKQHAYFKVVGEKTLEDTTMVKNLHDIQPLEVSISGKTANASFTNNSLTNLVKNQRQINQTVVSYLTAAEAAKSGLDKTINSYPFNNFGTFTPPANHQPIPSDSLQRVAGYRKPHHLSEITVTDGSGKQMVYGIPVYNISQAEYSFAVGSAYTILPNTNNQVQLALNNPGTPSVSINHTKGIDNYYHRQTQPSYASSFLISAILSPDYMDKTGNGITSDDLGTAIKFDYSKTAQTFKWRSNQQISISYINASGKTVATALTGPAPASMDSLTSSVPVTQHTLNLLDSSKFVFDPAALKVTATTTYLASVTGSAKLKYNIQKLIDKYPGSADSICSNCYYDLTIKVYDDCKDSIYKTATPVPIGALSSDCGDHGLQTDSVTVTFPQIGEYYVTFELAFSKTVMENYTDHFVTAGQANGALKKEFDFILPYLDSLDLRGCLSDCTTNEQTLGTQGHFSQAVKDKLLALDVDSASLASSAFTTWVAAEYTSLKAYVDSTQVTCSSSIASSPCDQYLKPMEDDVSPGGQYALFDANNNPLDTANNVLYTYWRVQFPPTSPTDTATYNLGLVTLPNGTVTSAYDSTFTLKQLVQYWKLSWADKFLSYHPEYCKLQFCQDNASYEIWDQTVQDSILKASQIPNIPGAPSGFHYDYTDGAWLLPADPFFKAGAPGAALKTDFQNDLLNYSRNVLQNNPAKVKDLVKFVDFITYCSNPNFTSNSSNNPVDNWDNCDPVAGCRVPDREWNTYKEFYLELKDKYYNKVRLTTTCANKCTVGTPIPFPTASPCPDITDFTLNNYSSADGTPGATCDTGKQMMTLAYAPGNVGTRVQVTLTYATGIDTTGLPQSFTFAKGDRNKMFCVPENILPQSISIQSAVCDSCAVDPLLFTSWTNDQIIQNVYSGPTIISRDTLHVDSQLYYHGILVIKPGNTFNVADSLHTYTGSWQLDDSCRFALYGNNNVKYNLNTVSGTALSLTHRVGNVEELWYYTATGNAITCATPDTIHVTALQGNNTYFKGAYPNRHLITVIAGSAGTPPAFTCVNSSGVDTTSTSAYHTCLSIYTPYSIVKYQNSWVFDCVYDNVPANCSPELLTKESRFHDSFPPPIAADSATTVQQGKSQLTAQVNSTCEANAGNWMAALAAGLTGHSADTAALKAKFIAICELGGDLQHPFGASTVPTGTSGPGGYNSFGDAIKGVLHLSNFTTTLNPWLISSPYPYSPLQQGNYKNIANSDPSICAMLAQLQTNCDAYNTAHGTSLTLFQYLALIYGKAMILSADDLASLQNSCGNCKYLLNDDITLPVFLDPGTQGCIVPADYSTAKSSLLAQFGGSLDTTDTNYQTIYANFMNQRWGFMLSYDQYKDYDAKLTGTPDAILCNHIISEAPPTDTLACIEAQLAVGVANGKTAYNAYIEIEKNLFRASYVSTCSAAAANVHLTAPQKIYHYTLYYYDQADNLVRTIPPEGVTLLASSQFGKVDSARNSGDTSKAVYPQHKIPTYYAYNSTNQVTTQQSPDGGTNRFWYDLLSRLTISENDKQLPNHQYSYTKYDSLGRITEVGQKHQTTVNIGTPDYLSNTTISSFNAAGTNAQITNTYYDIQPAAGNGIQSIPLNNLRKRVALTTYKATASDTVTQATYYDYDLDGNVKNLYQQVQGLGVKRINYEYDLISGKVNFVAYQNGKPDQFYYQYSYDADNRLTQAWSSIKADTTSYGFFSKLDPAKQKLDATYQYYLHGPLARMELGNTSAKVQGVDYAYTLQGWLKGVNSQVLNPAQDMGRDSATVAKDAYGYSLGYYTNDYKPIGGTGFTAFADQYTQNSGDITGQSLYNGNISTATYAISAISSGAPVGYTYHYDQLNRIKHLRQHSSITSWSSSNINSGYSEDFSFDGNGNILTLLRSGTSSATKDSLIYKYNVTAGRLINNRLNWLNGHGAATSMGTDQSANNYKYDAIGNLTDDAQARIDSIHWSVYGKITDMLDSTKTIAYKYNTAQERVTKTANGLITWYVRDARGNTLAIYDNKASQVNWREQHLPGVERIGMWRPNVNLATNNASTVWDTIGHKNYELTNQLGNVGVIITDARTSHTGYYTPNIVSAQDYYAFGAIMPGRDTSSGKYRYGFNGKENDNEVKGVGNQQDYGERIYDSRIGRFNSVDPLGKDYPELSSYQFASNTPIQAADLNGGEADFSKAKLNIIETNSTQTQNQKTNIFLINTAVSIYNNVVNLAELVTNENPIYNAIDHGRGFKKVYNSATSTVKGVYNWTANTSWNDKKQNLIDASHNPHTYEGLAGLALLDNLGEFSPIVKTDAPILLPEAENIPTRTLSKSEQLRINKAVSLESESIVRARLESQIGDDEIILEKPRIYINDEKGNLTNSYAVPDFAVIDRESGKVVKIVDAKNGESGLTGNQRKLDQYGGKFKGSKRLKRSVSQDIKSNSIKIEKTNVPLQ